MEFMENHPAAFWIVSTLIVLLVGLFAYIAGHVFPSRWFMPVNKDKEKLAWQVVDQIKRNACYSVSLQSEDRATLFSAIDEVTKKFVAERLQK